MPPETVSGDVADSGLTQWTVEVMEGPNKGAIVQMEPGSLHIGSAAENDIVLADGAMAGNQAVFGLSEGVAEVETLSPGMTVDGAEMISGQTLTMQDGMVLQAGSTVFAVHGPHRRSSRRLWLMAAVPLILLLAAGAALIGPGAPAPSAPPPRVPGAASVAPPAEEARQALQTRLNEAGLAERITLHAAAGAVVAEGTVSTADLAQWSEQQMWFDGRYHGSLSLVNRVTTAAAEDMPNIHLRAVSAGAVPYLIAENGDRFVEGAVIEGWTIEQIAQDKVVFSKNGRRVEEGF